MAARQRPTAPASIVLVVGLVVTGFLLAGCSGDDSADWPTIAATSDDETAALEAADQAADGTMVVRRVLVPEPGAYVAVYEVSNGAPGRRIAASPLLSPGEHDDVTIDLGEEAETISDVFLMLHGEASGNGELEHPGPDEPVTDDGGVLTVQIALG